MAEIKYQVLRTLPQLCWTPRSLSVRAHHVNSWHYMPPHTQGIDCRFCQQALYSTIRNICFDYLPSSVSLHSSFFPQYSSFVRIS